MSNKKFIELNGASNESMSDAIQHALQGGCRKSTRYEVLETLSKSDGQNQHYQIILKAFVEDSPA